MALLKDERFEVECETARKKLSTSKSEVIVGKRVACLLQVGNEDLPQGA